MYTSERVFMFSEQVLDASVQHIQSMVDRGGAELSLLIGVCGAEPKTRLILRMLNVEFQYLSEDIKPPPNIDYSEKASLATVFKYSYYVYYS